MARPSFTKKVVGEVINDNPPGEMNTFSTVKAHHNMGWDQKIG